MSKSSLLLIFLLTVGCNTGIVVHDGVRAAELVVDFLSSLQSGPGIQLAYDWTDDKYKERVSFSEFTEIVSFIRESNLGADIRLHGYETFGSRETIVVYAKSETSEGKMYFKFTLAGTKTRDYYLLSLNIDESEFNKSGVYKVYRKPILVQGV